MHSKHQLSRREFRLFISALRPCKGSANAIVLFNPLTPEVIHENSRREVNGALERLRDRGYDTEVPAEGVAFIATDGYEPAYGARHLHRSIERHLLQTLVSHSPSKLRAQVVDTSVVWSPLGLDT